MSNTKQIRVTDEEKIKIREYYIECHNYTKVGKKFHRSDNTIRKIIAEYDDIEEKFEQKKQECIETTLEHMEKQHELKKNVLDKLLKGIELKANDIKKMDKMNIKDLATAYGIILDKELKVLELKRNSGNIENEINNNIMNIADLINNPVPNRSEEDVQ
ncbi:MAG: hypothetical protein IKO78_02570 [Bacilli bacterium]|nr:hypothetical protein [Bacilli bacterium]